uniref:Uncharacterized protein n=1 Tax=Sarcophilus harrisii TaxID=9305 RepID=A0A7N4PE27_SARHA
TPRRKAGEDATGGETRVHKGDFCGSAKPDPLEDGPQKIPTDNGEKLPKGKKGNADDAKNGGAKTDRGGKLKVLEMPKKLLLSDKWGL